MKFFCEYCGCRIDSKRDDKCPNCGASYKKNKEFLNRINAKNERKRLSEEEIKKEKLKRTKASKIVLVVGILIGILIISIGLINQLNINNRYSKTNREEMSKKLEKEADELMAKKQELQDKGVKVNLFAMYTDGDEYDLKIITEALDPAFDNCAFDEYKNNKLTAEYCSIKNELDDISSDFNKDFDSHDSIPFFMFGAFIIIASLMVSGGLKATANVQSVGDTIRNTVINRINDEIEKEDE